MRRAQRVLVITLFTVISAISVTAQPDTTVIRDFESWNAIGVKTNIIKNLRLVVDEEIRLKHNASEVDKFFTDASLRYSFLEHFYITGNYRYEREQKKKGYVTNNRYAGDAGYKQEIGKLELGLRFRYQYQATPNTPISKLRLKLSADYNIKDWKLDPSFSAEIFHRYYTHDAIQYIDQVVQQPYKTHDWEKIRFTFGTSYKIRKVGTIQGYYRLERELKQHYPKTTHIIGLSFRYEVKKRKKDDQSK